MIDTGLDRFVADVRSGWGPLTSEMAAQCAIALERLARTPATEPWLAAVLGRAATTEELHRDTAQGFLLLAHTEPEGMYRPSHDHGNYAGLGVTIKRLLTDNRAAFRSREFAAACAALGIRYKFTRA